MGKSIIKNPRKVFSQNNSGTSGNNIESIVSGTDITIDNTDPQNPIINFSGNYQQPITVVTNYSALPAANTVSGKFYWVSNTQGTKWLPGSLGGTFYNKGIYYSNGTDWEYIDVPYQATQATVDTGTNTDQFITPATLTNATVITNKVLKVISTDNAVVRFDGTGGAVQNSLVTIDDSGNEIANSFTASGETASRVAGFDSNKKITSLDTATYPDLTELSYGKGVTSAIQTQLDSKATTGIVMHSAAVQSPADNITYYIGAFSALAPVSAAGQRKVYPPAPITITGCTINAVIAGTLGSNENVAVSIRVNNTTDYLIGNLTLDSAGQITLQNTAMTIPALATTDYYEVKFAHPAYATNPTNVYYTAIISYK